MTIYTQPRTNMDELQRLLRLPPFGGEGGYNTEGDVLVNVTADGVDVNALWAEVQAVLSAWNAERNAVANLLKSLYDQRGRRGAAIDKRRQL